MEKTKITVARGDGIGPEIMGAVLRVLEAAGAAIEIDEIHIGESGYLEGFKSGIQPGDWDVIRRNQVLLKAPITTPLGEGYNSLNVAIRKRFGLGANVRPTKSYEPFVRTVQPNTDIVIVRENEEGLYGGVEHQQTSEMLYNLEGERGYSLAHGE